MKKKKKPPKGVAEAWYVTPVGAFTSKQTNMGITTGSDFFFCGEISQPNKLEKKTGDCGFSNVNSKKILPKKMEKMAG
jgi:hypothetical protein